MFDFTFPFVPILSYALHGPLIQCFSLFHVGGCVNQKCVQLQWLIKTHVVRPDVANGASWTTSKRQSLRWSWLYLHEHIMVSQYQALHPNSRKEKDGKKLITATFAPFKNHKLSRIPFTFYGHKPGVRCQKCWERKYLAFPVSTCEADKSGKS